jgi:carbon-monoxide dehydrogenase small subunit
MSGKRHIMTRINGEEVEFLTEPAESLLTVLRDDLGLTGSKEGCNNGNCGACNVILNGSLVNACCVLGVEANGAEIITIEGIAQGENLHPLQTSFLENAALQCGICTPGFIVAAKALLDKEPNADEARIRHWLAGNLCRCTGYDKIIRAVLDAAGQMRQTAVTS